MHLSQRSGCFVYPLVLFVSLAAPGLLAQNSTSAQPPSTQPQSQPESQQPENPEADQARLAQQAQARIRARRKQRMQQAIEDTYTHKYEIYGGGGYMRFHPGANLQHINEPAWNGGFTYYLRRKLGLTVDFRGLYGTAYVGNNPYGLFKPAITQFTFMAGPQYRVMQRQRWAVSAQALVGATKGTFNGNSSLFPGTLLGMWSNGIDFSAGAAVPIDLNLGPGLAWRLSPNYMVTTFGGATQIKNLGFTSGLVYRFGRQ